MSKVKDEIVAAIYKRAMRVDRIKTFPGTKKIGIVIRTGRLEHETIRYLIDLAEAYKGKFSISTDRTGRQLFSAMIVLEDDPRAAPPPKAAPEPPPTPGVSSRDACQECARIYTRFAFDADRRIHKVIQVDSPIPDMVKFKGTFVREGGEPGVGSEFYLHAECAELLKLISAA